MATSKKDTNVSFDSVIEKGLKLMDRELSRFELMQTLNSDCAAILTDYMRTLSNIKRENKKVEDLIEKQLNEMSDDELDKLTKDD